VAADEVEASYEKGVLSIMLPRAEADKPRKITIKAG
jgi:HSP20 family protein